MTIREAIDSIAPLKDLLDKEVNGRTAFLLARIIREIEKIYQDFQVSKNKIIEKYADYDSTTKMCKTDEHGNILIPNSSLPDFNKEFNALLDTHLKVMIEPISLTDLGQLNFTTQQMINLLPFIKE